MSGYTVNQKLRASDFDGAWQTFTLQNSWTNRGAPYPNAAYRKSGNHVEILMNISPGTVTNGTIVATLPTGYRPASTIGINVAGRVNAAPGPTPVVEVDSSGNIKVYDAGSGNAVVVHDSIPLDL